MRGAPKSVILQSGKVPLLSCMPAVVHLFVQSMREQFEFWLKSTNPFPRNSVLYFRVIWGGVILSVQIF